jgi:hypothetical protein
MVTASRRERDGTDFPFHPCRRAAARRSGHLTAGIVTARRPRVKSRLSVTVAWAD